MDLNESTARWGYQTSKLPWGVQKVFLDTLTLIKEEKIQIAWGADYFGDRPGKSPCLINAAATMLAATGGAGGYYLPMATFHDVVANFDRINSHLLQAGMNETNLVSPEAAHYLITNFGSLEKVSGVKAPEPEEEAAALEVVNGVTEFFDALAQECGSSLLPLVNVGTHDAD